MQTVGFAISRDFLAVVRQGIIRHLRRSRGIDLDIAVVDAFLVDILIEIRRRVVRAVQIAAVRTFPASRDVQERVGTRVLDLFAAVVLLRRVACSHRQRCAVDLVRRRRKAVVRPRRRIIDNSIPRLVVDDVVVRIVRAAGILTVDLERVLDPLVCRIGRIRSSGRRDGGIRHIGCRRRIRAVRAGREDRILLALGVVEFHEVIGIRRRIVDTHIRIGVVRLFDGLRARIELAPLDVALGIDAAAVVVDHRAIRRIDEAIVVPVRSIALHGIGDIVAVRVHRRRRDVCIRHLWRSGGSPLLIIALRASERNLVARNDILLHQGQAILDVLDVRRAVIRLACIAVELDAQIFRRDLARIVGMVNAVDHAAAVGIRRLERVKIEVVQRLVRELELEEHLLARAHVLVVRRIRSIAVRR